MQNFQDYLKQKTGTDIRSNIKQTTNIPVVNNGMSRQQKGYNFNAVKPQVPQPTQQPQKPTQEITQQETQQPVKGRGPTNLFINEKQALENMIASGIDEETALQAIKEKRIEKWGSTELSPQESNALIQMANADIDINEAIKAVKEKRYDDATILQKIGKNVLDLSAAGPALVAEQMANVGSFVMQDDELKQQAENIRKIRKTDFESTLGGKTGSFVTGLGEMVATGPTKIAPTMGGRMLQGAVVGGGIGAVDPILQKGSEATTGDIVGGGVKGAAIGAVSVPVMEKVVAPAVGGVIQKTTKYGKALTKGGVEGLGKSVGRDVSKIGTNVADVIGDINTKGLSPKAAYKLSTKSNRFNAKDIEDFTRITGESPGEFAVKRGMTKTGDGAVEEATKLYKKSMDQADESLKLIQGTFRQKTGTDSMGTMLKDLNKRLINTASDDAPKINKLLQKYKTEGLTMSEINEVKRLYSRNFKYNWTELGSEKALKSKNIQDGVRKWQFDVAEKEGLTNLKEINKTTQGWKTFADNLGKKLKRSEGNNAVSITDFIALSGGEPTNIALYLGKKAGGSKFIKEGLIKGLAKQTQPNIIQGTKQNIINRNIANKYGINNNISNLGSSSRVSNKPSIKGLLPSGTTKNAPKTIILPGKSAIKTPAPGYNKVVNPQSIKPLSTKTPKNEISNKVLQKTTKTGGKKPLIEKVRANKTIQKLGDKVDDYADKTGIRSKFIDNSKGTGISGKIEEQVLDSVNPTGGVYVDYNPAKRVNSLIDSNKLSTLDKTLGKPANETITIYRGTVKGQSNINAGDFITTNKDLAKSYGNNVISKKVKYSDIIDDIKDVGGEEYLYIPKTMQNWKKIKAPIIKANSKGVMNAPNSIDITKIKNNPNIIKDLQKQGYSGIKNSRGEFIFNKSKGLKPKK